MGDRDAPTTAGPVVICCANADADTIRPVVEDLEGQGHMVVLLDGVERSPERLAPSVERLRGEGLYVLCRSKALGRNAVDELRDILLAHHVPFGRTLTVASTRPRELRERIGASLRRLASSNARRLSTVSPDGPSPRGRTRLGLPTPPKPKPKPDNDFEFEPATDVRPAAATKTQLGLPAPTSPPSVPVEDDDPLEVTHNLEPLRGPAPEPLDAEATDLDVDEGLEDLEDVEGLEDLELLVDEAEPAARLTPAVESEAAPEAVEVSASKTLIRPDDLADLDDPVVAADAPLPPVRSGNTRVSPILKSQLAAIRTGDTAIVSREALIAAGLTELDQPEAPAPPPQPLGPATVRAPAVSATVRAPAVEPIAEGSSGPPWKWIGIGGGALALLVVLAVALTGGDDEATEDDTVARAEQTDKDNADDPADDDVHEASDAESEDEDTEPGAGPTRIGHALRSREIRSLDVLLVSNTEGPVSWDAAREHCGGLDLAGLQTWRLPEVGELMSLSKASMTKPGYYWTGTAADTFGDTPLVWYPRRGKVVTRDRDSFVLCVRGGKEQETAAG